MNTHFSRVCMFCNRIDVSEVCVSSVSLDVGWITVQSGCIYYHSTSCLAGSCTSPFATILPLQCTSDPPSDGCKKLMCTLNNRSAPFPHLFLDIREQCGPTLAFAEPKSLQAKLKGNQIWRLQRNQVKNRVWDLVHLALVSFKYAQNLKGPGHLETLSRKLLPLTLEGWIEQGREAWGPQGQRIRISFQVSCTSVVWAVAQVVIAGVKFLFITKLSNHLQKVCIHAPETNANIGKLLLHI